MTPSSKRKMRGWGCAACSRAAQKWRRRRKESSDGGAAGIGPFPHQPRHCLLSRCVSFSPSPSKAVEHHNPPPPPHGPRSPPKPGPPRRAAAPHRAANRGAAAPSGGGGRGMRGSGGGCLCMWGGVSVPQPSRGWQVTRNCKNIPPFSFRRLLRSEEP